MLSTLSVRPAPSRAATKLELTIGTLHAAALTAPRNAVDSTDAPYILVSVLGPRTTSDAMRLPASGHLQIRLDQAIGARPLVNLSLEPGDSVRLLVSVLTNGKVEDAAERTAASAGTRALALASTQRSAQVASALTPLTRTGARWLGSATLLVTNDAGTTYWRALECVATCTVLSGGGAAAIAPAAAPVVGVVQLSGAGGTYHMQLQGRQVP